MIFRNQQITFFSEVIEIVNLQEDTVTSANPIYITDDGIVIKRPEETKEFIAGDGISLTESGSPTGTELTVGVKLDTTDQNNPLSIDVNGNLVFDGSQFSTDDYVAKTGDIMTGALLFNGAANSDNSIGTSGPKTFTIKYNDEERIKINGNIEVNANVRPRLTDTTDLGETNKRWNTIHTKNINLRNNTDSYFYIGDVNTDGSWRFFVNPSGELEFQKRESGIWEYRSKMI